MKKIFRHILLNTDWLNFLLVLIALLLPFLQEIKRNTALNFNLWESTKIAAHYPIELWVIVSVLFGFIILQFILRKISYRYADINEFDEWKLEILRRNMGDKSLAELTNELMAIKIEIPDEIKGMYTERGNLLHVFLHYREEFDSGIYTSYDPNPTGRAETTWLRKTIAPLLKEYHLAEVSENCVQLSNLGVKLAKSFNDWQKVKRLEKGKKIKHPA
jgi:hypothetical protein